LKLLLLYEEVYSYSYSVIGKLESLYNYKIHLVHWGVNESAKSHKNFYNPSYKVYIKSDNFLRLLNLARKINPDVVVIPGWNDKSYLGIALWARKNNKAVVCTLDTQYTKTLKQVLAKYLGFWIIRKLFYSHIWIPGYPQLYTACKLGFTSDEMIYDLLSADSEIFITPNPDLLESKSYQCINFLFVGRLEKEKGVETLISAWRVFSKGNKNYNLTIVGSGSLEGDISSLENISYKGYLDPCGVASLMRNMDCLILPSYSEPWALVIHEAVLSGMAIICTKECGASSFFVIDGYNGFLIDKRNEVSLELAMNSFVNLSIEEKRKFSQRSEKLGKKITTSTSAARFNSFFKSKV